MSAPRVFKGREEEMTMEQLAASSAAAIQSTSGGSEFEDLPLIKSDITSSPAVNARPVASETKKRKAGRPLKASRAVKNLTLAENPEVAVGTSQSAVPSAENSSSSPYATPDSPSLNRRKVLKVGEYFENVPNQRATPVTRMQSSARELSQGANVYNSDDDMRDDAIPEPVSVPTRRGRPRKNQTPIPVNTTGKGKSKTKLPRLVSRRLLPRRYAKTNRRGIIDSVRTTRASARIGSEKAAPAKTPQVQAVPTKRVFASWFFLFRDSELTKRMTGFFILWPRCWSSQEDSPQRKFGHPAVHQGGVCRGEDRRLPHRPHHQRADVYGEVEELRREGQHLGAGE
ncbi:chromo domain-containing protein [Colletotrichum graminicola]|nr:chromo domain-containing protein [Colletotrichum graminicola]